MRARTVDAGSARYLIVRAGTTLYDLPVGRIRRILRALAVHPLAGSVPALLGLGQLGGEPIGVLDLGRLVNPKAVPSEPGVSVVVRVGPAEGPETVALAVDDALEIVAPPAGAVAPVDERLVIGEVGIRGGVARILDLSQLGGSA